MLFQSVFVCFYVCIISSLHFISLITLLSRLLILLTRFGYFISICFCFRKIHQNNAVEPTSIRHVDGDGGTSTTVRTSITHCNQLALDTFDVTVEHIYYKNSISKRYVLVESRDDKDDEYLEMRKRKKDV